MKNITCLLIDDDEEDQLLFLEAIKEFAHSVKCLFSFNGKEALDRLLSGHYKPDVIFLDLRMPLMDGFQFLKERMSHAFIRHIPVYVLTDYFHDYDHAEGVALGVKGAISKPLVLTEWEQRLKSVLNL